MRVGTIKAIDEYGGRILATLARVPLRSSDVEDLRRVLFIKLWGLGSIVLASSCVRAVRREYPGAELHMLTLAENRPVCDHLDLFDTVHTVRMASPATLGIDGARVLRAIRRVRFDAVVDLELFARSSALIAAWSGAGRRIGFEKPSSELLTDVVPFDPAIHVAESFAAIGTALTKAPIARRPRIEVRREDAESIGERFERLGIAPGTRVVAMNINASPLAYERRWPRARFAEIASRFSRRFGAHVVLTGSQAERDYVRGLIDDLRQPASVSSVAGELSFGELVALLARSSLLVTNDSGPLHVASALNLPTIALFGPETPARYGPLSDDRLVLYAGLACSPCMSVENRKTVNCRYDQLCMRSINADGAWARIEPFAERIFAKTRLEEAV